MIKNFFYLFFPKNCINCKQVIAKTQNMLCISCTDALPITQYHLCATENLLLDKFFFHEQLTHAAAFYYFRKKSIVFRMIENLKYKNAPKIGNCLGKKYGFVLKKQADWIQYFDYIIPVPLHFKKLRKRGYNQSNCFAEGLSQTLQLPWKNKILIRKIDTKTQTKKNRSERFQNMKYVFAIKNPEKIQNKNIIIVDDVVTTGATLTACIDVLSQWVNQIAILTIAVAE